MKLLECDLSCSYILMKSIVLRKTNKALRLNFSQGLIPSLCGLSAYLINKLTKIYLGTSSSKDILKNISCLHSQSTIYVRFETKAYVRM